MTATPLILGEQKMQVSVDGFLAQRMENLSGGQPKYVGHAPPGSGTANPSWRIQYMEYDNGQNLPPTAVLFAGGKADFDKVWNDRATYSYS